MKKVLLVVVSLLFLTGWAHAQVFADFETDVSGFSVLNWSSGCLGVSKVADPAGKSTGCLQVSLDLSSGGSGHIQKTGMTATSAQILTYYMYLPADVPDSLSITIFAQDNKNWNHTTETTYAVDIPKKTWFPVTFHITQWELKKPTTFDVANNSFGWFGVQFTDPKAQWKGNILIDNVTWTGVKPTVLADFEADANGFAILGWSDGATNVAKVADPTGKSTGVLDVTCVSNSAGNNSALINKSSVSSQSTSMTDLVYWVYLPANMPDQVNFTIFCQDNKNWNHTIQTTNVAGLPRKTWVPIYFPIQAWELKKSTFDVANNAFGWFGLQIDLHGWSGDVLIDNVGFLSNIVQPIWVLTDFETPAADVNGFYIPTTQKTVTSLTRILDPNDPKQKNHALDAGINLALGTDGAIEMDNALLYSSSEKKNVAQITLDLFVPANFPAGATASLALNGVGTSNKLLNGETNFVNPGKWNTIVLTTKPMIDAKTLDPTKAVSILAQIHLAASQSWKGDILVDNLTYIGISPIIGNMVSPLTIAQVKSSTVDGAPASVAFNYILLQWIDNVSAGKETYNIYASNKAPITSKYATDVIMVASGIPHGQLAWGFRPFSSDGSQQTYYLAMTCSQGGFESEFSAQAKIGPIKIKTTKTVKVQYVPAFASKFVLDGRDGEFQPYTVNQVNPELGGATRPWFPGNADFDWRATFVIDDSYLYMSTVVNDDEPNMATGLPGWSSDMEYFFGFYDASQLQILPRRGISNSTSDGNWRIGIAPNGELETGGSNNGMTIPGVEAKTFLWPYKNGYTIEARFDVNKLGQLGQFTVAPGALLPFRIDGSDNDPSKGDGTNRGNFAQAFGWGSITSDGVQMDYNWERPSTFGYLEIVGLTGVAQGKGLPTSYALYDNYPNPFNPTTKIKYDLPKESQVSLRIFDILGREVASLVNEKQNAGSYEVNFNANKLASGVYIYRLSAGSYVQVKKMMLLK